jgi:aminoglycoside/choline kinase family phosphotransferase
MSTGWKVLLVVKWVQFSQIDSKLQSSSAGRVHQPFPVVDLAARTACGVIDFGDAGPSPWWHDLVGLWEDRFVERFDLGADCLVFVGNNTI